MDLFGYTDLTMFTRWTLCTFLPTLPESQTCYFHIFLSGYQCSRPNCYLLILWPVVFGRFVSRLWPLAWLHSVFPSPFHMSAKQINNRNESHRNPQPNHAHFRPVSPKGNATTTSTNNKRMHNTSYQTGLRTLVTILGNPCR